ncbi:hypothetical protein [Rhizobium sp. NXC24]|uniref:hypothetical protein n=1 Tax=Rhizobium sp. NXC24 TaxID=2048897 RepID=UPI000CDF4539|nr:hypothetical protein [Rhizobium sp. NXC24]AVA21595.1 hypothetical protein NXC24_CH01956 [Rhizobium sp. NXC24]
MPHPHRMIPDRELNNFRVFLTANPHLTAPPSEGAFDAKPQNIRRVPGKQIRVLLKDFSKGGKFDTARYAMDGDPDGVVSPGEAGMAFLRELASKLSPEGWAALREACMEAETGDDEEDDNERAAKDSPPSFSGMPKPGGEFADDRPPAMDSAAAKSFAQRFPDAARLQVNTMGQQSAPKPSHMTAKGAASFYEMYPEAKRIKV